jgi:hypothetical protein
MACPIPGQTKNDKTPAATERPEILPDCGGLLLEAIAGIHEVTNVMTKTINTAGRAIDRFRENMATDFQTHNTLLFSVIMSSHFENPLEESSKKGASKKERRKKKPLVKTPLQRVN